MKNFLSSKHERFGGWIPSFDRKAIRLTMSVLILGGGLVCMRIHAETHTHGNHTGEPDWSELIASMDKMHMAMGAIKRSGDADVGILVMLPSMGNRHGEGSTLIWQGSTNAETGAGNRHRTAVRDRVDAALAE